MTNCSQLKISTNVCFCFNKKVTDFLVTAIGFGGSFGPARDSRLKTVLLTGSGISFGVKITPVKCRLFENIR